MGVSLVLSACALATPAAPPSAASGEMTAVAPGPSLGGAVTWMVTGDSIEFDAYQRIAAAFERANPDLKVDLVYVPASGDYRSRLDADIAAGTPADVVFVNYQRYAMLADKKQLFPVTDYLAASSRLRESDFFSAAMAPVKWRGQTWCIPSNMSSAVIYYNKRLFDQAGIAYPKPGWSWDDFVAAGKAITRDDADAGRIYGFGSEVSLFRMAPYIWSAGGDLVDSPDAPTRLAVDSDQAVAALQRFVDLQVKYQIAPNAVAERAEDALARFMRGRLGMYMDSRRVTAQLRDTLKDRFDWDVAALPSQGETVSILHSDDYCIPAGAKNKVGAWKLIEYAAGPEGQTTMTTIGRLVPSLRSIALSPVFLDQTVRPANAKIWLETTLRAAPIHKNWPAIESGLTKELEKAYFGQQTVQDAVSTAVKQAESLFR